MSAGVPPLLREGLHRSRGAGLAGCGVISLLVLSPRSHSPGCPHAEQGGYGDVPWLMATRSLPAAGSGRGGARPHAWGTSIFISIPGFFGNLENQTRSANILRGKEGEACNCSANLLGGQSEPPWINAPATMSVRHQWLCSTHATPLLGPGERPG